MKRRRHFLFLAPAFYLLLQVVGLPLPWGISRANAEPVKVVFWNIADGFTSENQRHRSLDQSLSLLIEEEKIDILVLAEYRDYSLLSKTKKALDSFYQHVLSVPYPTSMHNPSNLKIYSKLPIEDMKITSLGWKANIPPILADRHYPITKYFTDEVGEQLQYRRNYHRFTFRIGGESFHFIPLHLVNPWSYLAQNIGWTATYIYIATGIYTPLAVQTRAVFRALKEDADQIGNPILKGKVFLFGDLNTPITEYNQYLPFDEAYSYRLFAEEFDDAIREFQGFKPSFPVPGSSSNGPSQQVRIDHIFTNAIEELSNADVLPLKGSDHYPILFVIESGSH